MSPVPSVNLSSTGTCLVNPLRVNSVLRAEFIVAKFIRVMYKARMSSY